jgi:hypothetical protein
MAPGCSRRQLCDHNRAEKRSLDGCGRNFKSVTRFGQGFHRTGRNFAVVAAAAQVFSALRAANGSGQKNPKHGEGANMKEPNELWEQLGQATSLQRQRKPISGAGRVVWASPGGPGARISRFQGSKPGGQSSPGEKNSGCACTTGPAQSRQS